MKILLEVSEEKGELFLEFVKALSFVKKAEVAEPNQIINPRLLNSIEDYESGKIKASPVSLADLKSLLDAQP